MNSNVAMVLWLYAVAVVAGGLLGFLKAGSKVSLYVSLAAAAIIAMVALGFVPFLVVAQVEMGVLALYFITRFAKSRKPMPAIPMIVLSLGALALTFVLNHA